MMTDHARPSASNFGVKRIQCEIAHDLLITRTATYFRKYDGSLAIRRPPFFSGGGIWSPQGIFACVLRGRQPAERFLRCFVVVFAAARPRPCSGAPAIPDLFDDLKGSMLALIFS
jgi:hypothetical protein